MSLKIRVDSPAATIILDRPERSNALSRELISDLITTFGDLLQEKKVRAVVVTGTGSSFCSGTDLHELNASYEAQDAFLSWHQDVSLLRELIETMLRFPKPIIAAVNGWVVGSGLALMLASDVIIASPNAHLQIPEAQRGLSPGLTIPLLTFRLGKSTLGHWLYSGKPITADTALAAGLIHEIVKDDLLWVQGMELAKAYARGARESHQIIKRMLNETIGEELFTQLSLGAADMASARITDTAREGVAAFVEKREPKWD